MRLKSLAAFEYMAPKDVADVCSVLTEQGERARAMSGGTAS